MMSGSKGDSFTWLRQFAHTQTMLCMTLQYANCAN